MDQFLVHIVNETEVDTRVESKMGVLLLQPGEHGVLRVKPGPQLVRLQAMGRGARKIATVQEIELASDSFQQARLKITDMGGHLNLAG